MGAIINPALNTTALAFVGDAVYEVHVRKRILMSGQTGADRLHGSAVRYVMAEKQAKALKAIYDELTEDEKDLVRRARNRRTTSKPKNADPVLYKLATAFEALVGFLYISENEERLNEILNLAVEAIENGEQK